MDARCAESVVRKWQNIKSEALGPDHSIGKLSEVKNFYLVFFAFVSLQKSIRNIFYIHIKKVEGLGYANRNIVLPP